MCQINNYQNMPLTAQWTQGSDSDSRVSPTSLVTRQTSVFHNLTSPSLKGRGWSAEVSFDILRIEHSALLRTDEKLILNGEGLLELQGHEIMAPTQHSGLSSNDPSSEKPFPTPASLPKEASSSQLMSFIALRLSETILSILHVTRLSPCECKRAKSRNHVTCSLPNAGFLWVQGT